MRWFQRLIHRLLPRDRYHDLAGKVNNRGLRVELLNKRLEVYERRQRPR